MRNILEQGEGGLDKSLYKLTTIIQSLRDVSEFNYHRSERTLETNRAGQTRHRRSHKAKSNQHVAKTRMIPEGTDASHLPQHDIYSIEDLRQLIYALKENKLHQTHFRKDRRSPHQPQSQVAWYGQTLCPWYQGNRCSA
jgi:glutamate synthase domain-containing protein 2